MFAFSKEPNKDDKVPTLIQGLCACPSFVGLVKHVLVSCANFFPSTLFLGREIGGGKGGLSGSPPYLPAARNSGRAERVARGRLYGRQGFMATNARLRTFVICVKGDVHYMAIGGQGYCAGDCDRDFPGNTFMSWYISCKHYQGFQHQSQYPNYFLQLSSSIGCTQIHF